MPPRRKVGAVKHLTISVRTAEMVGAFTSAHNRTLEVAMKRFLVVATCLALGALVMLSVGHAPAQQGDQAVKDNRAKIKALQEERVALLSQVAKIGEVQYKLGTIDVGQFAAAELDLVNSQIEYSETAEERVGYLEKAAR